MGTMIRGAISLVILLISVASAEAVTPPVTLDDSCTVHVLNRSVQVQKSGDWAMPNVPSTMGKIRARVTCVQNGVTHHGQSGYFTVVSDGSTDVGVITFLNLELVPVSIAYQVSSFLLTSGPGATLNLQTTATYADGTSKDVTSDPGINYISSNPAIATVAPSGLVTAVANGNAVITARKDGRVALASIRISFFGADSDGDGIPDEQEIALGLNPNDPIDALEDQDADGLTALEEYNLGTNIFVADTDGDGIKDGVEVSGSNGFITNPLLSDTDGDGLSDGIEIIVGSDPTNGASTNLTAALSSIEVTSTGATIVFNSIDGEATQQLTVTGHLIDGSTIDLTPVSRGTTYSSSDSAVASFGLQSGLVFAGRTGTVTITVNSNGFQATFPMLIKAFTPKGVAYIDLPGEPHGVDVLGNDAYIAAGSAGLQIVDVSNPIVPVIAGALDTFGSAMDVKVVGNYAYVADGVDGLKIIDISNPAAPLLSSAVPMTGIAQGVAFSAGYVYVATGSGGLQVVDVRIPLQASIVGSLTGIGNVVDVDVQGTLVVIAAEASIITVDVSNPAAPILLSRANVGPVKDVVLQGSYAHIAAGNMGYASVDVSNPTNIFIAGTVFVEGPRSLAIDGKHVFTNDAGNYSLPYINIIDPATPLYEGKFRTYPVPAPSPSSSGMAASGSFLYSCVKRNGNGLAIYQHKPLLDVVAMAPSVALTAPSFGTVLVPNQQLTISATASDDVEVVSVFFYVNNIFLSADVTAPYEAIYSIPAAYIGGITISAVAQDIGGNESRVVDVPFQVTANTAPSIRLSQPAPQMVYSEGDVVAMAASVTDAEGVDHVDFLIDGVVVGSASVPPYLFDYRVPYNFPAGGVIQASAIVTDTGGLTATTAPAALVVNTNPLQSAYISLISPATWTAGSQNVINVAVMDRTPPTRAELFVNRVIVSTSTYFNIYSGGFTFVYKPMAPGSITVFARVYGQAGSFVDTPSQIYQVAAVPSPSNGFLTIQLHKMDGGAVFSSATVPSGGAVIADSYLGLQAHFDNATQINFYANGQLIGSKPAYSGSATFNYHPPLAGDFVIQAEGLANDGQAALSNTVNLVVTPNQLPNVSMVAPVSWSIIEGTSAVQLQAVASDDDNIGWVQFLVNGQIVGVARNDGSIGSQYSFEYKLPATVTAGSTLNITARAFDWSKNSGWRYVESAPVMLNVIADPMTTAAGRVVDRNGVPVVGAIVRMDPDTGVMAKTALDGTFTALMAPTTGGNLTVRAKAVVGGYLLAGNSIPLTPISGGVVPAGDIVLDRLAVGEESLIAPNNGNIDGLASATDSSGNLHMVWVQRDPASPGSPDVLRYKMLNALGEVMIAETSLTTNSSASRPDIAFDPSGHLHVTWTSRACALNIYGWVRCDGIMEVMHLALDPLLAPQDGSAADPAIIEIIPPHTVSTVDSLVSKKSHLAVGPSGNVNLVWRDALVDPLTTGQSSIRYVALSGVTGIALGSERQVAALSNAEYLALNLFSHGKEDITVDSNGGVHLAWIDNYYDNAGLWHREAHYLMQDGYSSAVLIPNTIIKDDVNPGSLYSSCYLASGAGDIVHMLYAGATQEYFRLMPYATARNGSPVSLPLLVGASSLLGENAGRAWAGGPVGDLLEDAAGDVHIIWGGSNGQSNFYQRINSAGIPANSGRATLASKLFLRALSIDPVLKRLEVLGVRNRSGIVKQSLQTGATVSISGQITLADGTPAAGARVLAGTPGESHEMAADGAGNYIFPAIPLTLGSDAGIRAYFRNAGVSTMTAQNMRLLPGDNIQLGSAVLQSTVAPAFDLSLGYSLVFNNGVTYIPFPGNMLFPFYGKMYKGMFVSRNGRIDFDYGDARRSHGLTYLQSQPEIAPWQTAVRLSRGEVDVNTSLPGRVVVTWNSVEHSIRSRPHKVNTVQVVLHESGQIQFGYTLMENWYEPSLVGISAGASVPADILSVGLSQANLVGGTERIIYQDFPRDSFDIRYSLLNFVPNMEGGYDASASPMTSIPLLP